MTPVDPKAETLPPPVDIPNSYPQRMPENVHHIVVGNLTFIRSFGNGRTWLCFHVAGAIRLIQTNNASWLCGFTEGDAAVDSVTGLGPGASHDATYQLVVTKFLRLCRERALLLSKLAFEGGL